MALKVGIIGAGIGGLSAAIALRRAGAHVEVSIANIQRLSSSNIV